MRHVELIVPKLTDAEMASLCCVGDFIKQEAATEDAIYSAMAVQTTEGEMEFITVKEEPIDWHQGPQTSSSRSHENPTAVRGTPGVSAVTVPATGVLTSAPPSTAALPSKAGPLDSDDILTLVVSNTFDSEGTEVNYTPVSTVGSSFNPASHNSQASPSLVPTLGLPSHGSRQNVTSASRTASIPVLSQKKRKLIETRDTDDQLLELIKEKMKKADDEDSNELGLWGKLMGSELSRADEMQCLIAKNKIQDVVLKARLGLLKPDD